MKQVKKICIYCGSRPGRLEVYASSARRLAESLVSRQIDLVYGGASVGIMGVVADHVLKLGGKVTGVIPDALVRKEVAHHNLTELHITRSMHERKTLMAELSDGFIALPGGIGTLEELFEIWTWAQLGLHDKPCGLLNVEGYFDPLRKFLDHAVAEQFVKQSDRAMMMIDSEPEVLLDRLVNYQPPAVAKWMGEEET
ncbi:MAG: LOG family protein [Gammaproteobacteria bacterium]